MGLPAKKMSPVKMKKTVLAAAVFKKHDPRTHPGSTTSQANRGNPNFTDEDADATTVLSAKSRSSPRSAEKRITKKKPSEMHPLGVAFRGIAEFLRYRSVGN
jgi:hypothetical protein